MIPICCLAHGLSLLYGVRLGFLSDQALIAAQAHTRGLYLVQRGNREQRYYYITSISRWEYFAIIVRAIQFRFCSYHNVRADIIQECVE